MAAGGQPPPLPFAHAADLVRAHQKDEHFRDVLRRQVCDALEEIVGHRRAAPWQATAVWLSDLAYAATTAVSSGSTLGEEYCELLAVSTTEGGGLRRVSQRRRVLAVLFALIPFVSSLEALGRGGAQRRGFFGIGRLVRRLASLLAAAAPLTSRVHLAIFYISGSFHHLADRFAGLRYISLSQQPYRNFTYRPLGFLIFAQLLGQAFAWYFRRRRAKKDSAQPSVASGSVVAAPGAGVWSTSPRANRRQPTCRICMCPCDDVTATPCGHLFCWDCIASWCALKASCPLCRTAALPQRLLPLNHYEATSPEMT